MSLIVPVEHHALRTAATDEARVLVNDTELGIEIVDVQTSVLEQLTVPVVVVPVYVLPVQHEHVSEVLFAGFRRKPVAVLFGRRTSWENAKKRRRRLTGARAFLAWKHSDSSTSCDNSAYQRGARKKLFTENVGLKHHIY